MRKTLLALAGCLILSGLAAEASAGDKNRSSSNNSNTAVSRSTTTLQNRLPAPPPSIGSGTPRRITPYGTTPMVPNTPRSKYPIRSLHTNPPPAPRTNQNPRWNPTGDKTIDKAYRDYQAKHKR